MKVYSFKDQADLVRWLREWKSEFAKEKVNHVAIDVTPGKPIV